MRAYSSLVAVFAALLTVGCNNDEPNVPEIDPIVSIYEMTSANGLQLPSDIENFQINDNVTCRKQENGDVAVGSGLGFVVSHTVTLSECTDSDFNKSDTTSRDGDVRVINRGSEYFFDDLSINNDDGSCFLDGTTLFCSLGDNFNGIDFEAVQQ